MNNRYNSIYFPSQRRTHASNDNSLTKKHCSNGHEYMSSSYDSCDSCANLRMANKNRKHPVQMYPPLAPSPPPSSTRQSHRTSNHQTLMRRNSGTMTAQQPRSYFPPVMASQALLSSNNSRPSTSQPQLHRTVLAISRPLGLNQIPSTSSANSDDIVEVPQKPPEMPKKPLKFKHLPFFDVEKQLFGPQPLLPNKSDKDYLAMNIDLKIPPEFIDNIKIHKTHDVQLRIYHQKDGMDPIIQYPVYFDIYIDNIIIGLNGRTEGLIVQKAVLNEALLLGTKIKSTPNKIHKLVMRWKPYTARDYYVCVSYVRLLKVKELYDKVMERAAFATNMTQKMILKKFGDDDELAMLNFKETLCCPCVTKRITNPARSVNCDHVRCFDLKNFIMLHEKRPIWKCPICNREAPFSTILVDSYFTDVLDKMKGNPINEIEFSKDGSWKPFVPKNDNTVNLDDDDDDESPVKVERLEGDSKTIAKSKILTDPRLNKAKRPVATILPFLNGNAHKPTSSSATTSRTTSNGELDIIILSDSSEDESDVPATTIQNNNTTYPSVITLDSDQDSPASTPRRSLELTPNTSSQQRLPPTVEECEDLIRDLVAVSPTPSVEVLFNDEQRNVDVLVRNNEINHEEPSNQQIESTSNGQEHFEHQNEEEENRHQPSTNDDVLAVEKEGEQQQLSVNEVAEEQTTQSQIDEELPKTPIDNFVNESHSVEDEQQQLTSANETVETQNHRPSLTNENVSNESIFDEEETNAEEKNLPRNKFTEVSVEDGFPKSSMINNFNGTTNDSEREGSIEFVEERQGEKNTRRFRGRQPKNPQQKPTEKTSVIKKERKKGGRKLKAEKLIEEEKSTPIDPVSEEAPKKRGRGRPPKIQKEAVQNLSPLSRTLTKEQLEDEEIQRTPTSRASIQNVRRRKSLIAEFSMEQEKVDQPVEVQKSRPGRKRKSTVEESQIVEDQPTSEEMPKVPKRRGRKPKSTNEVQPTNDNKQQEPVVENDQIDEDQPIIDETPKNSKGRGRGRKPKSTNEVQPTNDNEQQEPVVEESQIVEDQQTGENVPKVPKRRGRKPKPTNEVQSTNNNEQQDPIVENNQIDEAQPTNEETPNVPQRRGQKPTSINEVQPAIEELTNVSKRPGRKRKLVEENQINLQKRLGQKPTSTVEEQTIEDDAQQKETAKETKHKIKNKQSDLQQKESSKIFEDEATEDESPQEPIAEQPPKQKRGRPKTNKNLVKNQTSSIEVESKKDESTTQDSHKPDNHLVEEKPSTSTQKCHEFSLPDFMLQSTTERNLENSAFKTNEDSTSSTEPDIKIPKTAQITTRVPNRRKSNLSRDADLPSVKVIQIEDGLQKNEVQEVVKKSARKRKQKEIFEPSPSATNRSSYRKK